eukprot:TRINITY_DN14184_c0_g1_i5.p1 TRINITY_DN14184_c0_g1~~TRINITY_DN14184_c0_g1_i5.p1  ORF type:complete len:217 (+),score=55.81 TRINITY_DN14184_c0_g1_i5:104-754(+)
MTAAAAAVKVKEVLLRCSFNESDPIVRCAHLLLTPCLEDEASKVEVEHVQAELIEELPEEEAEEAPEHMAMMYSPRPGHELGGYQEAAVAPAVPVPRAEDFHEPLPAWQAPLSTSRRASPDAHRSSFLTEKRAAPRGSPERRVFQDRFKDGVFQEDEPVIEPAEWGVPHFTSPLAAKFRGGSRQYHEMHAVEASQTLTTLSQLAEMRPTSDMKRSI